MEQRIRERFSGAILAEALGRYEIPRGQCRLLDGFESFIYEVEREGVPGILRLAHSLRRTPQLIQAEADWILHLAAGGASVAKPWLSPRGNLVEAVADGEGGQFLATAFDKAPGRKPGRLAVTPSAETVPGGVASTWPEALEEEYGRLVGRMHALAQSYVPPHPDCVRPHWNDPATLVVEPYLPAGSERIVDRYRGLLTQLNALPTPANAYGLIHQDAHGGNFFVDDAGRITVFDFDDCCYGHFVYDLAMILFYTIPRERQGDAVRSFWPPFWRGYRSENELDVGWLREIPLFLKLREIDMYALLHRSFDIRSLPEDSWVRRFLAEHGPRIEAAVPYIDFDFERLHELK